LTVGGEIPAKVGQQSGYNVAARRDHDSGRGMRTAMRPAHMTRTAVAAVFLINGAAPGVADAADAVTTPGSGSLTICRSWLVYDSCTTYQKVALPERIAVGDKLSLTYGSNPKDYTFSVYSIRHQDASCTILSDTAGGGEKLEVAQCQKVANPAGIAR
jgi:hypothetical protein